MTLAEALRAASSCSQEVMPAFASVPDRLGIGAMDGHGSDHQRTCDTPRPGATISSAVARALRARRSPPAGPGAWPESSGSHSSARPPACAAVVTPSAPAASLELQSVSEVSTLRTCGARQSATKPAASRSGATHLSRKSISPESIQHSRTSGSLRTKSSNALRSASAWLDRCTMANTVTS